MAHYSVEIGVSLKVKLVDVQGPDLDQNHAAQADSV